MSKKIQSPGAKYLKSINFTPARGENGFLRGLKKVYGQRDVDIILDKLSSFNELNTELYNFVEAEPKISKCYAEVYECDIIKIHDILDRSLAIQFLSKLY